MDRQNEDPAGTNRGAENDNQDRNNGHTHSSGNGSAQDQPKGATGYNWRQFVYTSKQLRTMVFPPITFIVPGLIPSVGVTLICAKPKIGKSWLLLDTCLSATTQDAVLYLALEDGQRRMQDRHAKLLTFDNEWTGNLTIANKWRRVDQGGLNDIREWVEETRAAGRKVAFIAVDVLTKIRPSTNKAKSAYEADYDALVGLCEIAIDLDVAIIVTHHTRKAEAEDLIDKVSGTFGLAGAADTIIVIEQRGNNWIFDVRGRDVAADQLAAKFDKSTYRWTILGHTAEHSEQTLKQEKESLAQTMMEEALDRHGTEIKPNGGDVVRAVRKDTVRSFFKAAYLAEHAGADAATVRKAWQRALRQAKATVAEGVVDGVSYLWRSASAS